MKIAPHQVTMKPRKIIIIFFALVVCVGTLFSHYYLPQASAIGMIIVSMMFYLYLFDVDVNSAAIVTMIGYGISYLAYSFAALVLSVLIFAYEKVSLQASGILPYIAAGPLQFLFVFLLFRIRRFQRGIPVLTYIKYGDVGVYLSITVLIAIYILGLSDHPTVVIPVIIGLLFMCGLALFSLWKNRITQDYLTQLSQREKQNLHAEIDALHKELVSLKEDHSRLSQVVHKDNKIIPAMELAVSQLLFSLSQDEDQKIRVEQARNLLEQLKTLSQERAGIIHNYEAMSQKLPSLGLSGLDALFCFMMQKANMAGIAFDVQVDEGADKTLIQNISDSDACTLLADLVENALIAAGHSQQEKAVQVELGTNGGVFHIRVCDSGDLIPTEVLERWGKERITTHADTGGSGIGMMTIHELCQKYNASFYTQPLQDMLPYHKYVCIQFDGLCTFQAH